MASFTPCPARAARWGWCLPVPPPRRPEAKPQRGDNSFEGEKDNLSQLKAVGAIPGLQPGGAGPGWGRGRRGAVGGDAGEAGGGGHTGGAEARGGAEPVERERRWLAQRFCLPEEKMPSGAGGGRGGAGRGGGCTEGSWGGR